MWIPKVLADDVLVIATGARMLRRRARAVDETHAYLHDLGARVAPAKCFNFASTGSARRWLEDTWWKGIASKIPVVKDFRYLGAHVNTTKARKNATLDARASKAKLQLGRTAKLKAESEKQASIIRTKIHDGAFYDVETSDYTDRQVAELSSATIDVFK